MNLRAQPVTIGIVEDQPLYRNMLAVALSTDPQFNVMWAVGTVAEDRNALNSQRPAVLILDIDLPDGNGVALGVTVRRHLPHIGILLLSAHDAMDLLLDLPADVRNGWSYLSKTSSTSPQTLIKALLATSRGHTVLDPELVNHKQPRVGTAVAKLTNRQLEVLKLLAQGLSNSGIAEELGITEKSIQNHINAIYDTLDIDTDPARNPRVSAALKLLEHTGSL